MLYFSKLKLVIIYCIIIFLSLFAFANFIENKENFVLSKKELYFVLYFSKLKLAIIYFLIIFLSFCAFVNLVDNKENFFLSKKINLGLDLQGGSYLLLEVNSDPVTKIKLQQKL